MTHMPVTASVTLGDLTRKRVASHHAPGVTGLHVVTPWLYAARVLPLRQCLILHFTPTTTMSERKRKEQPDVLPIFHAIQGGYARG